MSTAPATGRTPLTFVTGGGRGIGAAVCRRLAAEGHDVVVGYRTDAGSAEQVAADVVAAGRRSATVRLDTTDEASVLAAYARVAEVGALTGLVNSAGAVTAVGPLATNDLADVRRDLDVNLLGVLACCKHAIGPLEATGGAIVNLSSAAATLGSAGEYVHYAAAKAAVDTLTLGLARELAGQGIRVNAVAPGVIRTGFHLDPERPDRLGPGIPLGRPGLPEEVAGAVAWLLSQDAAYTTGAVLRVAGGR